MTFHSIEKFYLLKSRIFSAMMHLFNSSLVSKVLFLSTKQSTRFAGPIILEFAPIMHPLSDELGSIIADPDIKFSNPNWFK